MAFVPKEWKDRLVEFAGRRKLTNVATGEEIIVNVARNEGAVSQEGDAFSAENMNELEQRVSEEFTKINSDFVENIYVGDDGKLHKVQGGADSVINFNNLELVCAYRPSYAVTTYFLENGVLTSYTGDNAESTNILRTFSSGSHLITVKKNCKILYSGYGKDPTIKDVEAGFSITFPCPDTSYLGYFLAIIG